MLRRIGGLRRGLRFRGGPGRVGPVVLEPRVGLQMAMGMTVRAGGVPG
jgi:hypothetical protein